MALGKTLLIFWLSVGGAKAQLPALLTKQVPGKMRYVSSNGAIYFYQKRKGVLAFSTNFNVLEILKGSPHAQHFVISGEENRLFLIARDNLFLTSNSLRHAADIYLFNAQDKSSRLLGKGLTSSVRMHLFGTWASFYRSHQRRIYLKSLVNSLLDFKLDINSTHHPYFIPEVFFIDNNRVLFSDVNQQGLVTLLLFSRDNKKVTVIYRPDTFGRKIELCAIRGKLYLAEFSFNGIHHGSQIVELDLTVALNYAKGRVIYDTPNSDYGGLICSAVFNKLYFVKTFSQGKHNYQYYSEAVELDPKTKKLASISQGKNITHIIEMDGRILIPHQGKFLIVKGGALKDDSLD